MSARPIKMGKGLALGVGLLKGSFLGLLLGVDQVEDLAIRTHLHPNSMSLLFPRGIDFSDRLSTFAAGKPRAFYDMNRLVTQVTHPLSWQ